ncbi:Serine/threonine-protein kinase plk4, partial [Cichlidogyrus casuarinus]
ILTHDVVQEKRQLIESEVEVHWKLRHESVLRLYGGFVETSSGSVCLLLELCPLGSLNDYVNSGKKCDSPKQTLLNDTHSSNVFYGLVSALNYIHNVHGIVHRDVKPANVMLKQDFSPKLSDFGLSCSLKQCQDNSQTICGTPNYLAPEVFLKLGHSFETDLWSLGCTLYFCISGRSPFQQQEPTSVNSHQSDIYSVMEETWQYVAIPLIGTDVPGTQARVSREQVLRSIYRQVITGRYHFPRNMSQAVRRVVRGLLQREPENRYSIGDLLTLRFAKLVTNSEKQSNCCQCLDEDVFPDTGPEEEPLNDNRNSSWRDSIDLSSLERPKKPPIATTDDSDVCSSADESSIASLAITGSSSVEVCFIAFVSLMCCASRELTGDSFAHLQLRSRTFLYL